MRAYVLLFLLLPCLQAEASILLNKIRQKRSSDPLDSPIGSNPRSNPFAYGDPIFDDILQDQDGFPWSKKVQSKTFNEIYKIDSAKDDYIKQLESKVDDLNDKVSQLTYLVMDSRAQKVDNSVKPDPWKPQYNYDNYDNSNDDKDDYDDYDSDYYDDYNDDDDSNESRSSSESSESWSYEDDDYYDDYSGDEDFK